MKINQNNDISIYRGETGAIDFKISQRTDYYVPFLISKARINPMVCISIGSTRRESKNIVTKQLWLELTTLPKFHQTTVTDLGQIDDTPFLNNNNYTTELHMALAAMFIPETMYQFTLKTEVDAGTPIVHFAYENLTDLGVVQLDTYDFTVVMAIDETITLDMTNTEYYYQIQLMDTEPMLDNLIDTFAANPALINKLPTAFAAAYATHAGNAITTYLAACITAVTKTYPNHWGYLINNPLTSPVASVSHIQMLQPPRDFIVQSVVK